MSKDDAEKMVGKSCTVKSYRVSGASGIIKSYLPRTHHFWVYLDEPIKNKSNGKLSNWHKCNAGNCYE